MKKFILRNGEKEKLATVLYFFEETSQQHVGMIYIKDWTQKTTRFYHDKKIDEIIADLADEVNIQYHEFIEVE